MKRACEIAYDIIIYNNVVGKRAGQTSEWATSKSHQKAEFWLLDISTTTE